MNDHFSARQLENTRSAVIGVSGGPDSLCLLDLARQIPNLKIVVAHFNHKLRPEADQEAGFVGRVVEQMGLPFVSEAGDVSDYAEEQKLSLEEAARTLRYRFLFKQARINGAEAVAVGHTADDQVETVLMHFLRGAGLPGLKGMAGRTILNEFDAEIPLVRPILHIWRTETEAYCREHDLKPVYDPSNNDETYFRNRLRHSLIPELEKYNPRIKNTLLRTAAALAGDYEAVAEAVDTIWSKVVLKEKSNLIIFQAATMEDLPSGLRRNLVRRAMENLRPGMRNIDFETLERAATFSGGKTNSLPPDLLPRKVDLSGGLTLYREGEAIYMAALEADLPSAHWPLIDKIHELPVNGQVRLNENFILSAKEMEAESARSIAFENGDPFAAWVDADLTGDRFTIRARREGDVFSPLGMNRQTVKMREFYIKVKIPRRARAGWPLVCAREQIVWVPGFRLAHPFRINDQTTRVVKFTLQAG